MKKEQPTFADFTGQFTNKPFRHHAHGQQGSDGYDCMGLVYAFLTKAGKKVPDNYGGWNLDNYQELFSRDRKAAYEVMFKVFETLGDPVPVHKKLAGDIVIMQQGDDWYYPAIFVGNGCIMAAFADCGVKVVSCDEKNKPVIVRRII